MAFMRLLDYYVQQIHSVLMHDSLFGLVHCLMIRSSTLFPRGIFFKGLDGYTVCELSS